MTNHRYGRPAETRHVVRYVVETSWGKRIVLDAGEDETALDQFERLAPPLSCNRGLKKTLIREVRTVLSEGRL